MHHFANRSTDQAEGIYAFEVEKIFKDKRISMYGDKAFGDVAPEKLGLIWVCLTPGKTFDIDDWLGDFAYDLETLDLNNWHIFEQRTI